MRRIREVLRLSAIVGENISAIARGGKLARSTVRDYLDRAKAAGIDAAQPRSLGNLLGSGLPGQAPGCHRSAVTRGDTHEFSHDFSLSRAKSQYFVT